MATRFLSKAEAEANRTHVLATYRHLLRATRIAFTGDTETLTASRRFARTSFDANLRLEVGDVGTAQAIEHAQGVTRILRENVVQGKHKGGEK